MPDDQLDDASGPNQYGGTGPAPPVVALPTPDFVPAAAMFRAVMAHLRSALVEGAAFTPRGRPDVVASVPAGTASGVYRFDGDVVAAVEAGVHARTGDEGGAPFVLVGFSSRDGARATVAGQPLVQRVPVDVFACLPIRGTGWIAADAEALDYVADLLTYFLRNEFFSPHEHGLAYVNEADADGGQFLGTSVNFRRVTFDVGRVFAR